MKSFEYEETSLHTLLSQSTHTQTSYLESDVFTLLLRDQIQDGAAVFAGSNQDLNPRPPGRQRGRQLVMRVTVSIKGVLWDLWWWDTKKNQSDSAFIENKHN